ncbi:hypothetical protein R1sor_016393 [Riccia sorocarpa]|uniref:Uncharacterized protein n=1 Tax=Riccia sorocarpa TaxID=122646 RepID=A0ABD3HIW0_9MARC
MMVTNPFGHQGFAGFRARFKKGIRYLSLAEAHCFCTSSRNKTSLSVHGERTGHTRIRSGGPSNAEAGEDGAADDDFAAAAAAAAGAAAVAAGETGDGVDDDALTDFSEGLSGAELEKDEHGLTPQHEQHAESGGDDEDDTPTGSASQRLARLVVGAPQPPAQPPDPRTVFPAPPAPRTVVPAPPAPRTVVPRH